MEGGGKRKEPREVADSKVHLSNHGPSHLCFGKGALQEILEEGIHSRAQVFGLRSLQAAECMERRL